MLSERDAMKRESSILMSSVMGDERLTSALMTVEQLTVKLSEQQRDHQQQVVNTAFRPTTKAWPLYFDLC